jgi:NAD/NADP transhydrogenase beta subunit
MLITISQLIIGSVDLIAAFLLMFGLWRMASPVTAPSGILVAGVGMLAAVVASFLYVFTVDARREAAPATQYRARRGRARSSVPESPGGVVFFGIALVFGILMTLPIGGADMPVVISIYNAFTGLAVGLEGFVLQNPALMIAGMVVGAAGLLLTLLMAKAMNRSVATSCSPTSATAPSTSRAPSRAAQADAGRRRRHRMRYASLVIIVPGYGLAVAQGQQQAL